MTGKELDKTLKDIRAKLNELARRVEHLEKETLIKPDGTRGSGVG